MKKNLINPFLYIALGATLVLAAIGAKSLVQYQSINNNSTDIKDVSPKQQATGSPSSTLTPTVYTKPTTAPKTALQENIAVQKRIAEIDAELTKLNEEYSTCKTEFDNAPQTHPNDASSYMIVMMSCMSSTQKRIDTLNAEKSNLLIN